ncbi:hypothetical protein AZ78_0422 [Lysobacter capsici AZ78]|uniref:Uncharacterized protein n=1 Tax=Lysobacter capsici AZ78 TaxID=1444315 RepID=A0A108U5F0_9GAMM|nr:hypothetical protein AZ78_0422 [Lysobacter capsici AZ78]
MNRRDDSLNCRVARRPRAQPPSRRVVRAARHPPRMFPTAVAPATPSVSSTSCFFNIH